MIQVELITMTDDAASVIESAGRTAYLSFDKETPLPIIRGRCGEKQRMFRAEEDESWISVKEGDVFESDGLAWRAEKVWKNSAEKFLEMLVRSGHFSVLEHASAAFRIRGGSRAFTHQLVRHRMATFTQQSQRYVDETAFRYVEPPSIREHSEAHALYAMCMEQIRNIYVRLQELGIRNEDARFVLPNGAESEIVMSANVREWRHIIEMRGGTMAQWEIRGAMIGIFRILREKLPSAFIDFSIDEEKELIVRKNP